MMKIDFSKTARQIHNQIRALTGTAFLNGKRVKIYKTLITDGKGECGKVLSLNPFVVACKEGALEIVELQPEGKKRMLSSAFVNGLRNAKADELKFS